jgi:uncharacterized protein DUF5752
MTNSTTIPALRETAVRPFYFNTSAHLLRISREKAETLSDLLQALRQCSEESIFQHTFRTLEEHHFLQEGFSNDFAQWTLADCNEPGLAECLAGVDVREFTSVAEIRGRFVEIVEQYLRVHPRVGERRAEDLFYFCASDIIVMPTSFVANTLAEFAEGLRKVSVHSIHHHFIEARLRLKLMSNDFSQWLHEDMSLSGPARALNQIDIYTGTLEDVRRRIVRIVERAATS